LAYDPARMFEGQSPEIAYPCRWSYRIVGTSADAIRALVARLAGNALHELAPSRESASGKYVSFRFSMIVRDEAHRHEIFHALAAHETIRYVL
jgi:putative lipoic acid-binding regulatory protein